MPKWLTRRVASFVYRRAAAFAGKEIGKNNAKDEPENILGYS